MSGASPKDQGDNVKGNTAGVLATDIDVKLDIHDNDNNDNDHSDGIHAAETRSLRGNLDAQIRSREASTNEGKWIFGMKRVATKYPTDFTDDLTHSTSRQTLSNSNNKNSSTDTSANKRKMIKTQAGSQPQQSTQAMGKETVQQLSEHNIYSQTILSTKPKTHTNTNTKTKTISNDNGDSVEVNTVAKNNDHDTYSMDNYNSKNSPFDESISVATDRDIVDAKIPPLAVQYERYIRTLITSTYTKSQFDIYQVLAYRRCVNPDKKNYIKPLKIFDGILDSKYSDCQIPFLNQYQRILGQAILCFSIQV